MAGRFTWKHNTQQVQICASTKKKNQNNWYTNTLSTSLWLLNNGHERVGSDTPATPCINMCARTSSHWCARKFHSEQCNIVSIKFMAPNGDGWQDANTSKVHAFIWSCNTQKCGKLYYSATNNTNHVTHTTSRGTQQTMWYNDITVSSNIHIALANSCVILSRKLTSSIYQQTYTTCNRTTTLYMW